MLTSTNRPGGGGGNAAGSAFGAAGSVTVYFWSAAKSVNSWMHPLGHDTVTRAIRASSPRPKCTTGSELDNTPRARLSCRTCTPEAVSTRTRAPTPKRFDCVPSSAKSTRCPVSESLRSNVTPFL